MRFSLKAASPMPRSAVSKQLKHNITQDCAWRTMTDQKRLLLGNYGGPTVADGARCMVFSVFG
jgi:hypothetical protein